MTWLKPYYVTFMLLAFMVLKHGIRYVLQSLWSTPTMKAVDTAVSVAPAVMFSDAAVVALTGLFLVFLTRLGLAGVAWVLLLPTLAVLVASTIMFGIESVGAWRQSPRPSLQRPTASSSMPLAQEGVDVGSLLYVHEDGHDKLHFLRSLWRSHRACFL